MSRAGASCPEQLHSFSLQDLSPVARCDAPGAAVTCSSRLEFSLSHGLHWKGASLQGGCAFHWEGARAGACCPPHSLSPEEGGQRGHSGHGSGDTVPFPYDDFQSFWMGGTRISAPHTVA